MLLFYTPWKYQKTLRFSDILKGSRKATPGCNGLSWLWESFETCVWSSWGKRNISPHIFSITMKLKKNFKTMVSIYIPFGCHEVDGLRCFFIKILCRRITRIKKYWKLRDFQECWISFFFTQTFLGILLILRKGYTESYYYHAISWKANLVCIL